MKTSPPDFEETVVSEPFQNAAFKPVRSSTALPQPAGNSGKKRWILMLMALGFLGAAAWVGSKYLGEQVFAPGKFIGKLVGQEAAKPAAAAVEMPSGGAKMMALKLSLDAVLGGTRQAAQTLESVSDGQRVQIALLGKLEQDVAKLSGELGALQAQKAASARPVPRRVKRRWAGTAQAGAGRKNSVQSTQLLSVDMWDGKPSAAIGAGDAQDKRVRFLREGDAQSGVVLKKADSQEQRVVFDVRGKEVTISREVGN
jgi:hypothetical protein